MLEDYRLEEVCVPEVGEEEILVKVLAVGICAGDAKCFAGAPYFWGKFSHLDCVSKSPQKDDQKSLVVSQATPISRIKYERVREVKSMEQCNVIFFNATTWLINHYFLFSPSKRRKLQFVS